AAPEAAASALRVLLYNITSVRMESDGPLGDRERSVLAALEGGERPLSAYDILGRAPVETLKAPVQVYRALKKLERLGLVHRIEALNAFVACTHGRHRAHRPGFVICRACGSTRE